MFYLYKHELKFKQLGLNIAYFRKMRNLSQAQLADKVNISRTHMSRIEAPNMDKSFSIGTVFDISEALEIDVKELFDFYEQFQDITQNKKKQTGRRNDT